MHCTTEAKNEKDTEVQIMAEAPEAEEQATFDVGIAAINNTQFEHVTNAAQCALAKIMPCQVLALNATLTSLRE